MRVPPWPALRRDRLGRVRFEQWAACVGCAESWRFATRTSTRERGALENRCSGPTRTPESYHRLDLSHLERIALERQIQRRHHDRLAGSFLLNPSGQPRVVTRGFC